MSKKQKRVAIIIRCLPEERRALKVEAAQKSITLTELILGRVLKK